MWRPSAVLRICGTVLALAALPPGRANAGREGEVVVEHDSTLRVTDFSIASGECRIEWTVYATELNRGVIHHRADCTLPLAEQVPLMAKVMGRLLESDADSTRFRTLSWGRLYPDGKPDTTLAVRLALAAKRSAQWDVSRGVPRNGDVNGFVRTLANDAKIYEELRPVFRQFGLTLELASVEKVLVLPAGRLPFFESLRHRGVRARDKVPFDCMAWFSIRAAGPGTPP
jgi:hypothetical protein